MQDSTICPRIRKYTQVDEEGKCTYSPKPEVCDGCVLLSGRKIVAARESNRMLDSATQLSREMGVLWKEKGV